MALQASKITLFTLTAVGVSNATYTRSDNKVRELATVCLPWQQRTQTSVWFDDVGIPSLQFGSTEKAA
jgi:hypothetical protein